MYFTVLIIALVLAVIAALNTLIMEMNAHKEGVNLQQQMLDALLQRKTSTWVTGVLWTVVTVLTVLR